MCLGFRASQGFGVLGFVGLGFKSGVAWLNFVEDVSTHFHDLLAGGIKGFSRKEG